MHMSLACMNVYAPFACDAHVDQKRAGLPGPGVTDS